jgi:hypothetical protein
MALARRSTPAAMSSALSVLVAWDSVEIEDADVAAALQAGEFDEVGGGVGLGDGLGAGGAAGNHRQHAAAVGFPDAIGVFAGAGMIDAEVAAVFQSADGSPLREDSG